MCPKCKSFWELCPECERIAIGKAEFMEKLGTAMRKEERQVCCYGSGDSNWNSIEVALHGKNAIIR